MNELQYLVGAALSIAVSCLVIRGTRAKSSTMRLLILFGLVVAIWEVFSYLYTTAPNEEKALVFFTVMALCTHVGYPLYFLTFLSIRNPLKKRILSLVTISIAVEILLLLHPDYPSQFEFQQTDSGWHYIVVGYSLPLKIDMFIFMSYLAAVGIGLLKLVMETDAALLKKKYAILLVSFVLFQLIGILMTNALMAINLLNPGFKFGGIFQFLTFLSIWYALALRGKGISVTIESEDFYEVYSSFLTIYYNSAVDSLLGEEVSEFRAFLRSCGIEDEVSVDNERVAFGAREDVDVAELINRNLRFSDAHQLSNQILDSYLRVLNASHTKLGLKFGDVVEKNERFLKKSDLIYGISGGRFLGKITEDGSLGDLDDVDACLRIYKRILLPIIGEIQVNADFQKKFSQFHVNDVMNVSDYGEISIKAVEKRHLRSSMSLLIQRFNSFLSWVYGELLMGPEANTEVILDKLKLVLRLNNEKADALGIYPSLLGMLATKIPKTQIHRLYSDYLEELVEERTLELKETQAHLLKSQRLAAIGEAAAMVGHDLRNPLQAIVNVLYIAEKELESSQNQRLKEVHTVIGERVKYMNKIVSDLQDYARPVEPKLVETSLYQLLDETLSGANIAENIQVSIDIEEGLPTLLLDPLLMKRVFTNLVTNAIQAMPEGGELTIGAYRSGEMVATYFKDTGVGISEENHDKIFQPLFTTKSKGQGLGLTVCKRLVEAVDGSITVESESGKGSTFTVRIPYRPKTPLNKTVAQPASDVLRNPLP